MNSRLFASLSALIMVLALAAPHARAQALLTPPPPPKSELERKLDAIQSVPQILAMGAKFASEDKWREYAFAMKRILDLRPQAANIRLELAAAYAMQDMKSECYDILVRMQSAGFGYDIGADERFEKVHGTGVWDYLVEGFKTNAKATGDGKVAFTTPAQDLLIESVAFDKARGKFLVGSVRTGEVMIADGQGALTPFIAPNAENGLLGVFDLAVDAPHDALWIASAGIPHVKHAKAADYGRGGLWKFKLSTGAFQGKWLVDTDGRNHLPASVTVNPQGQVFIADHVTGQIWTTAGDKLRVVVQNPKLTSVRAIAASDDGKYLYFAEYELGLFGLDLKTGRAFDVLVDPRASVFGLESLYWYKGGLAGVQTGIVPRRSVRLLLSEDGRMVRRAQPLDANRPDFGSPTRGALVGDTLYFVANSQKGGYDGYGVPRDASKLQGARVFASNLKVGDDSATGGVVRKLEKADGGP